MSLLLNTNMNVVVLKKAYVCHYFLNRNMNVVVLKKACICHHI